MSKFIGTIVDKSYYQEYQKKIGDRIYYYRICPYCEKEIHKGFSHLDGDSYAIAPAHNCDRWKDLRPQPKMPEFEWGQFIFREANDDRKK